MGRRKGKINKDKAGDVPNDMKLFKQVIDDLIRMINSSIKFCAHSNDLVRELVDQYLINNEKKNKNNVEKSKLILKEPSYIQNSSLYMNVDDNIDHIRLTSNGILYSLPKSVTNSLQGTFLYEQSGQDQRTVNDEIYLDYPYEETMFPFLIDYLMNKRINIEDMKLSDQFALLDMFEFCNLPLPEELMLTRERRGNMEKCNNMNIVYLQINGQFDTLLFNYLKKNELWENMVKSYGDGYVHCDMFYNSEDKKNYKYYYIIKNYEYIEYIYEYIKYNFIYIPQEDVKTINRKLLEKEMSSIFGKDGILAVKKGLGINRSFTVSTILNPQITKPLLNWLGQDKLWKLLFRASEHRYSVQSFHRYCDNKGETVVIIRHIGHSGFMNIFGGYTDQSWDNTDHWKSYSKEFLFTLSNEHGIPPTKYDYTSPKRGYGIGCDPSYGPIFGGGFDIAIADKCHNNRKSYCSSTSYATENTLQKKSLFVNTDKMLNNYFIVDDYEVWGRYQE
ncbi:hypothetical protein WA158_000937 [Blastocystis sp. Blastoise]